MLKEKFMAAPKIKNYSSFPIEGVANERNSSLLAATALSHKL